MDCNNPKEETVKTRKEILTSILFLLAVCLPLCAQDQRGVGTDRRLSYEHTFETNAVVALPEITTPEARRSLENVLAEKQTAVRDAEAFVARKGAERKMEGGFWLIEEQSVSEGKTTMRLVHFLSEAGPVTLAHKTVFEGEGAEKREIRNQSYTLQFFPDGRVERFIKRGSQRTDLRFYPSGGVMEYYVISGKVAVVSGRWEESGKVKHAKHRGSDGQP